MIVEAKIWSVANMLRVLSLEAMKEFYPYIGFGNTDPQKLWEMFADINESSGFDRSYPNFYCHYANYLKDKLLESDRRFLGIWVQEAWDGSDGSDMDLSNWANILLQAAYRGYDKEGISSDSQQKIDTVITSYKESWGREAFQEMVEDFKENTPLSDWDIKLHMMYGYNYFDRMYAPDPFSYIKSLHRGKILRQFVRTSPLLEDPEFPHQDFIKIGEQLMAQYGWMPEGVEVCDIRKLRTQRFYREIGREHYVVSHDFDPSKCLTLPAKSDEIS